MKNQIEFLLMSLIWGFIFIFIRQAVPYFGPILLIFFRTLFAGLALFPFILAKGLWPELKKNKFPIAFVGFFNSAFPFCLFTYASVTLPAAALVVLNATSPFFTTLLSVLYLKQKFEWFQTFGLFFGVAGVYILMGEKLGHNFDSTFLLSVFACLLACFSYGCMAVYSRKKFAQTSPWVLSGGTQIFSAGVLFFPSLFFLPKAPIPFSAWLSVLALGFFCTAYGYVLYFRIIRNLGPVVAVSATYVQTFVTTFLAIFLLKEPFQPSFFLGGILIVFGSVIILKILTPSSFLRFFS